MGPTATASRPFFSPAKCDTGQAYFEGTATFTWHKGMSWQVRQRSSDSLADAIVEQYGSSKYGNSGIKREEILEVSTASHNFETGQALSAINLTYIDENSGACYSVENWFQASKVYAKDGIHYGPYTALLSCMHPKRYLNMALDSKTKKQYLDDPLFQRIQNDIADASMACFRMEGMTFPLVPRSGFYDFLYIRALNQPQNRALSDSLMGFRAFTDIMFNPGSGKNKKFNTQARSCAIYVALRKRGVIEQAVHDFDFFLNAVSYDEVSNHDKNDAEPKSAQTSLDFSL